jgi:predicted ATPase
MSTHRNTKRRRVVWAVPHPRVGAARTVCYADRDGEATPMIESVQFQNFRALRDTTLPLGRFTLLVGPNASGKTTALRALTRQYKGLQDATFGANPTQGVKISYKFVAPPINGTFFIHWTDTTAQAGLVENRPELANAVDQWLSQTRLFSFNPVLAITPVQLRPHAELSATGENLPAVLDRLRDTQPERFEALNQELARWLPEFDRVLFDTPAPGQRGIMLRMRDGKHPVPISDLSQGTVLALAILTLAYLPHPPPLVAIEDPDHGLHPRLFRNVQDAMYRLAYPERYGEKRGPVQVVATTHSPYLLELYKEQPDEVVIAHKVGAEARFESLASRTDLKDMLEGATLGEVWYSGILGGVPPES